MQIHFGLPTQRLGPTVLTVGSFDGVHVGHRVVLGRVAEAARADGLLGAWITFDPHPRCVLDPANCPQQLTTLEERTGQVEPLGLDHAIVIEFNRELASLSAQDFMDRLLASVDVRRLVVGYDFALGRGRAGNVTWLREYGRQHGYEMDVVRAVGLDGEEVHSSDVRRVVTLGEVERAAKLLGRPYSILGLVEHGDEIGREIGWPTVNLAVAPGKLVPAHGIYAGHVRSRFGLHQAAISVGYRPTFNKTVLRVEAYLLDFAGDLYEERLEMTFVARLRDELKFKDADDLSAAIAKDVEDTRRILGSTPDS